MNAIMDLSDNATDTRTHHIKVSYTLVTEESAEQGDAAEYGWEDETGHDCTQRDTEDYDDMSPVSHALDFLTDNGATECSSWPWSMGAWYETEADTCWRTGDSKTKAFHLYGFSKAEQRELYRCLLKRDPDTGFPIL